MCDFSEPWVLLPNRDNSKGLLRVSNEVMHVELLAECLVYNKQAINGNLRMVIRWELIFTISWTGWYSSHHVPYLQFPLS